MVEREARGPWDWQGSVGGELSDSQVFLMRARLLPWHTTKYQLSLCRLKVSQVTVDSTDIAVGADEIQVLSAVTAIIEGQG